MLRFKYILFLFSIFLTTISIKAGNTQTQEQWVDSVFTSMSPDERLGQLFVYNFPLENNSKMLKRIEEYINNYHIGGILWWSGSFKDQAEMTNFAQSKSRVPLFITLDGEWGLAMRMKDALQFPKNMTLGAMQNEKMIFDFGVEVGRQCNEMGIHINFAPVLDVNLNPANPVINTRSFGDQPEIVLRYANAYMLGLQSMGVMAVGKHFPGHGDTFQDSHHELAIVTHNKAQLDSIDLLPYRELFKTGLESVMVGHISVPALDTTGTPASLSPLITTKLLKEELGFNGLIFTDALKMKGVAKNENVCLKALLAGNDILLDMENIKREFESIKKAIADSVISQSLIDEKCKKVLRYKYKAGLANYRPIELKGLEGRMLTPSGNNQVAQIAKKSVTIIKNEAEILPLKAIDKKTAILSVGRKTESTFTNTAQFYAKLDLFYLPQVLPDSEMVRLDSTLNSYDRIIIALQNDNVTDSILCSFMKKPEKILVFFTSPYTMAKYPMCIKESQACVEGFENTIALHSSAAQIIFGGVAASGSLPVTISEDYRQGQKIVTTKTRLEYSMPEELGYSSKAFEKIDSIAALAIKEKATPGCQILVAKNGKVIYQKSFGSHNYSTSTAVDNNSVFDLASVSKVTGTLPMVMKLYDEGEIKLEDKASKFIPSFRKNNKKLMTIKDLLFHQAGFKAFVPFYQAAINTENINRKLMQNSCDELYCLQVDENMWANKNFSYHEGMITKQADSIHTLQVADSMYILNSFKDSIWHMIAESKIEDAPKYVYSDLSFLSLQQIIERQYKQGLDTLVQNHFYKKLGANSTLYNPLSAIPKNRIVPTEVDSFLRKQQLQGFVHDQNAAFMGGVAGHAGLFSTANDLAKYFQMLLNKGEYGGERYLSEATCNTFIQTTNANGKRGLGFDRSTIANKKDPSNPHVVIGHYGFTGTCVWFDPEEELIYIFLSNRVNPNAWNKKLSKLNVRMKILEAIYEIIEK